MQTLMLGAVAMASFVAALFFYGFWRKTRDRFFLLFSAAFLLDAVNRAALGALNDISEEHEPLFYIVRLATFLLIIAAVVDKNLRSKGGG